LLALVEIVDERRKVIRVQAWHEGNWTAVYQEATAMKKELEELKAVLSARWEELYTPLQK
jgi:hypothetical protein